MSLMVSIKGKDYPLATNLRVAYLIQGQHNHMPYTKVFEGVGEMSLEDQIGMLYCAFRSANPEDAKKITQQVFLDHYLDNVKLGDMLAQLRDLASGIMGENQLTDDDKSASTSEETSSGN